jgi:hypothetical protein
MFICNQWCDFAFSTREDGRAIMKLVYTDSLWEGVQEVCTISKSLVKVLRLVDGDKLAMGYLFEAVGRAK